MHGNHIRLALGAALAAGLCPVAAAAQDGSRSDLMSLDVRSLRGEIGSRYNAALAATLDPAVVAADNNRFMWASQAKAQCGIALGFLKSRTKDPISIGRCADAFARMQDQPLMPQAVVPPTPVAPCNKGPFIVFFDWDRSEITPEAATILDSAASTYAGCGNAAVRIGGHADRSGGSDFNQGLSQRRADAVRGYLSGRTVRSDARAGKSSAHQQGAIGPGGDAGHGKSHSRALRADGKARPSARAAGRLSIVVGARTARSRNRTPDDASGQT